MKSQSPRRRPRAHGPLEKLDLRVEFSQEEILADLQYPAGQRRAKRRP